MNTIAALCLLFSSASVNAADQFCYECSSKSALCRYSVYDGQYLTKTPCSSSCFLRTEGNTVYRGCFDGWLGGIVKHNYVGCRSQEYLGEKVEWCFCKSSPDDSYSQPCNGASRDALSKMALPFEEPELDMKDKTLNYKPDENTKYFIPTDTEKFAAEDKEKNENLVTYDVQYEDPVTNIKQEEITKTPDRSLNDLSAVQHSSPVKTVQCYACHDSSPYCKRTVTKSTYVTIVNCKTQCFIRMEGKKIYRGCFDGWRSSAVESEYNGCRQQFYFGQMVEWCFCKTDLCNRVSIYELAFSSGAQVSHSGTVHHIAYGFSSDEKYPNIAKLGSDDSISNDKADTIHPTPDATLRTNSKSPQLIYTEIPLTGTVIGMCRRHRDGIYADPFDCARYVHCFSGFTYRRHCPEGTIWNDKRKNCDYYYRNGNNCLLQGYKSKALSTSLDKKYGLY